MVFEFLGLFDEPEPVDTVEDLLGSVDVELTNPAFLTGSFAYGIPHAKSDVDLVLLMSLDEARKLLGKPGCSTDPPKTMEEYVGVPNIRFGNLNLIICTTQAEYDGWKNGTQELVGKAPVDRSTAKRILREYCGQTPI